MPFFDLASLTKPLVTAPLTLQKLDLDADRRKQLGFQERESPLTVRQLLSHSAALPAWLPYTGEPLAEQLRRGLPQGHPLFRPGTQGLAVYSDLGYRLLAELLERETGRSFQELGEEATGLLQAPWPEPAQVVPDGPDAEAWALAEPTLPLPPRAPNLPQDANARAGMRGHAGFGCTPVQLKTWLQRWASSRIPARMAVETARASDGTVWGLGLQRVFDGAWHFGQLLSRIPLGIQGTHVMASISADLPEPLPAPKAGTGKPTAFWMHFGYTGPAVFIRPEDGLCIALLLHRRGPEGEILDLDTLRARRWRMLEAFLAQF
jgi:CubicO group peptidase (beta-lactamase class C family)